MPNADYQRKPGLLALGQERLWGGESMVIEDGEEDREASTDVEANEEGPVQVLDAPARATEVRDCDNGGLRVCGPSG